jgi:hypothetical protein
MVERSKYKNQGAETDRMAIIAPEITTSGILSGRTI